MHVHGPYKTRSAHVDAHCVYTNHQPSGSVRAPTAPQACWALEQHTDEVAAAIGMDPVEFRRTACIDTGDEGPTRQVYLPIGLQECIATASREGRLRAAVAGGRGDRRRRRLVAVVRRAVGRVREAQRRRIGRRSSRAPRSAAPAP